MRTVAQWCGSESRTLHDMVKNIREPFYIVGESSEWLPEQIGRQFRPPHSVRTPEAVEISPDILRQVSEVQGEDARTVQVLSSGYKYACKKP